MKFNKGTFGLFPAHMLKGLPPYQQVAFAWLCFHANNDGYCFPTLNTLAKEAGMSKATLCRALAELEQLGYLERTQRRTDTANLFTSTLYKIIRKNHVSIGDNDVSIGDNSVSPQDDGRVSAGDRNQTQINQNQSFNQRESQSFDKFYSSYPLKKSKEAARKAFTKINPSPELLQIILDAIENQKQEKVNQRQRGIEPSFWKHPATWLNGKCWEDEVNLTINLGKENATNKSNFRESPAQARLRSANEFADKKLKECIEQRKQREAGNNERASEDESGVGF